MKKYPKLKKVKEKIKKEIVPMKRQTKENIYNVPNFFTLSRIIITLILIYLIFNNASLKTVIILFVIGAITDAIDGNVARIWNLKTEFGRKFDMAADRFLFLGTAIALIIQYSSTGFFGSTQIAQIILTFSREIIATPFVVRAYFKKNHFPQVKLIGKVTTVIQAISFVVILFKLSFAWPVVLLTCFIGIFSGITYARDTMD